MQKILSILILSSLYLGLATIPTTLAQSSNASTAPISDVKALNDCIDKCQLVPNSTSDQKIICQNKCRSPQNQYLPPIVKPDLLPGPTFQNGNKRSGQEVTDYVTTKLLPKTATRLITIVAITSMLGLVYAGITYFSAFGDTEKGTKGKSIAIYAIVGLLISLLSFTIVQIISSLPLNTL